MRERMAAPTVKVAARTRTVPKTRLRRERRRRCLSQEELAEQIGTTPLTVSRWERGQSFPNPYYRRKLCDFFQSPPEFLGLVPESAPEMEQETLERPGTVPARIEHLLAEQLILEPAEYPPPLPAHGIIGRDEMLAALKAKLVRPVGSVCAISGLPGVGKSTLMAALAHDSEVRRHFYDGILWAGLGCTPNILGLLAGWGAALGVTSDETRQLTTVERWAKCLRARIGDRRMLILVDDVWALEDALAFKFGGPSCSYVAATRFADLAHRFAPRHTFVVRELDEEYSLALLACLAPRVAASEPAASHALVQAVGGLPLALSLLGSYLDVQAQSGQARRVRAALDRLRNAEARLRLSDHRAPLERPPSLPEGVPISLQTVIALSEVQLNAEARAAWRALAVFPPKPNTFSEYAALAVSGRPAETLDALTDAGLLECVGPGRYALHQTIVDYASLEGVSEDALRRMVTYFVDLVTSHATDYRALHRESRNILAALDVAHENGWNVELVRGVLALASFLQARGVYTVAELLLSRAQQAARSCGDGASMACIWLHLGRISEMQGDFACAEDRYHAGLRAAGDVGHDDLSCALLAHLGEVMIARGCYREAEPHLTEGLRLARAAKDRQRLALLLRLRGEVADCRGDFKRGEALYLAGLEEARAVADDELASALLQNLGVHAVKRGDVAAAEQLYLEGLRHASKIGHRQRISALLNNLGVLAHKRGQYAAAKALYEESLSLARLIGHPVRIANALQNLGTLSGDHADYARADECFGEALGIACAIGHSFLVSETLHEWGELAYKQADFTRARALLEDALHSAQEVHDAEVIAMVHFALARVAAAEGNLVDAHARGVKSLRLLKQQGHEQAIQAAEWLSRLSPPDIPSRRTRASGIPM